jgi:hypothetical protein
MLSALVMLADWSSCLQEKGEHNPCKKIYHGWNDCKKC